MAHKLCASSSRKGVKDTVSPVYPPRKKKIEHVNAIYNPEFLYFICSNKNTLFRSKENFEHIFNMMNSFFMKKVLQSMRKY